MNSGDMTHKYQGIITDDDIMQYRSSFDFKVQEATKRMHKFKSLREAGDFYSDLRKEINKRMYSPKLVPNGDFDIDYVSPAPFVPRVIWNDKHWNALRLREEILKGEWITEKKEEKHMFFKKLWRSIEGLETSVEKLHKEVLGDGIQHSTVSSEGTYYSRDLGLKQRVSSLESKEPDTIDCHTCGCVVRKEIAFRGHDRIEREEIFEPSTPISGFHDSKEVVHETWYCKLHKKGKNEYGSE